MEFLADRQYRESLESLYTAPAADDLSGVPACSVLRVAAIAFAASTIAVAIFCGLHLVAGIGPVGSAVATVAAVCVLSASFAALYPRRTQGLFSRRDAGVPPSSAFGLITSLIDTMPAAIVIKDHDGRYVAVNKVFKDWFGITDADEILGKTAGDVFSARETKVIETHDMDAMQREEFSEHEMSVTRPDGTVRWVLSRRYAIKAEDGSPAGIAVVNVDITENKRTRDEIADLLREREEHAAILQGFFDAFPFPIALKKPDGELIRLNPVTRNWWGYAPEEMIGGRSENFLPESVAWKAAELDQRVRDSNSLESLEGQVTCFDGKVREVLMMRFPLFAEEGKLIALGGFVLDVTEQRMVEKLLRDMNDELESQVAARTRELRAANEELQDALDEVKRTTEKLIESEKLAALAPMVAGVAHEINTPVGTAVTAASLIQERIKSLDHAFEDGQLTKAAMCTNLADIGESAQILMNNLGDANDLVRSFKQVSADQSSPALRQIQMKEYLNEVFTTLTPRIRENSLEIDLECDDTLIISTDPGALSQVIANLLLNCASHAYPGRVGGRVSIRVSKESAGTRLEFQDFGQGIAPDDLKSVFVPFFTTRRGDGGTGLGLSIVYNIVTSRLGGTITCQSVVGEGSCFTITLPELTSGPPPTEGRA